jgi:hypothetical protein
MFIRFKLYYYFNGRRMQIKLQQNIENLVVFGKLNSIVNHVVFGNHKQHVNLVATPS